MSKCADSATKRGRPRSEEKRMQIMSAAMELFTLNGFEGTSVDDIAAAAGVSKQTVYSNFGSKEALFGLAISKKCEQSGMGSSEIDPQIPPERMLPEIARRFVKLITSPEATRINAVCTANGETHPELSRIYFEHGIQQSVYAVENYLSAQHKKETLLVKDSRTAAWQFLCMLKAEEQMRQQYNVGRMSPVELWAYVDNTVAMFMRAYRSDRTD